MRYRVAKVLGPGCVTYGKPHKSFEEAHREYEFEDMRSGFTYIQEERNGEWLTLSESEIARRSRAVDEWTEISIATKAYIYRFRLPKKIEVPSDLSMGQRLEYALLSLLCDKMETEPREGF